jgi:hypothetical protein
MTEEQVKKHLWASFLTFMRDKTIYFNEENGEDIFDVKDVGQFIACGMRGEK